MMLRKMREKLAKLLIGRRFYHNCTFAAEESVKSVVHRHEEYIDRLVRCSDN